MMNKRNKEEKAGKQECNSGPGISRLVKSFTGRCLDETAFSEVFSFRYTYAYFLFLVSESQKLIPKIWFLSIILLSQT